LCASAPNCLPDDESVSDIPQFLSLHFGTNHHHTHVCYSVFSFYRQGISLLCQVPTITKPLLHLSTSDMLVLSHAFGNQLQIYLMDELSLSLSLSLSSFLGVVSGSFVL
jgi:hypothetical protein